MHDFLLGLYHVGWWCSCPCNQSRKPTRNASV